jgi:hypothetical protein
MLDVFPERNTVLSRYELTIIQYNVPEGAVNRCFSRWGDDILIAQTGQQDNDNKSTIQGLINANDGSMTVTE